MTEVLVWIGTAAVAFLASTLSGIAGFGGAMIFLPALVVVGFYMLAGS